MMLSTVVYLKEDPYSLPLSSLFVPCSFT